MPDEMRQPADELVAAVQLLWGSRPTRTRGPKPAYSLEEIVDAAIALADREGLAAVSMQLLAEQLHFTKMALYRYVPGRSELVALMADRAIGVPPALPPGPWRQQLEAWALAIFAGFMAHPWAIEATAGRRAVGPNEAEWMEHGLAALSGLGVPAASRLDALAVLAGHVRAFAQQLSATPVGDGTLDDFLEPLQRGMATDPSRFPILSAVMAQARQEETEGNGLIFGLNCILDGLERLVKETESKR